MGCLVLAFGVDDFSSSFPFGFGLSGHCPLHRFGDLHVFDFDGGDFDAPGLGLFVDDLAEAFVELAPFGEQGVEVGAS